MKNKVKQEEDTKENQYQKDVSKVMIEKQSGNAAMTISQIFDKVNFNNGEGAVIQGLDSIAIAESIEQQEALLAKGDLTSLENMLFSQTHTLNTIFNNLVIKMSSAQYLKNLEVFGRLALKAQNQTRQTASTLAEIKGIKKTTFIHQLNHAHNQQINNGADENYDHSPNERVLNDVDRCSTTSSQGENIKNSTLDLSEDAGGKTAISHERPQTWDAIRTDERITETVGRAEQDGTRGKKTG